MGGREREFKSKMEREHTSKMERGYTSKMERADYTMGPPRERDPISFLAVNHSSMHDFWRINNANHLNDHVPGPHDHHMMEPAGVRGGGHAVTETHHPGEYSLRPYNVFDHRSERKESPYAVHSPMDVSHSDVYSYANLQHQVASYAHGGSYHNSSGSSSSDSALHAAHATYTNFFNNPGPTSVVHHDFHPDHHDVHPNGRYNRNDRYEATDIVTTGSKRDWVEAPQAQYNFNERNTASGGNQYPLNSSVSVAVVPSSNHFAYSSSSVNMHAGMPAGPAEIMNRDIEAMNRDLAWKCPQSSKIITAITSAAEAVVRVHNRNGDYDDEEDDGEDDDDEYDPPRLFPMSQLEQDQSKRAAIIDHPYYPEVVAAHIRLFKIAATEDLSNQLDEIKRKFLKMQRSGTTKRIGDNRDLDNFFRSYVELLSKLADNIEAQVHEMMVFKDDQSKQLEEIMGYYVDTNPDESDNYGLDFVSGPVNVGKEMEELEKLTKEFTYDDVDQSIIIDPSLPDAELKKLLRKKFGRHIGALKAEFGRVKKKGKLPSHARSILKEWFNHHSYWPYPTEGEKHQLHRMCMLNLKQINNWFINERKRHWSCEGKCMHPNAKLYNSANGQNGDKGHCHHEFRP